MQRWDDLTIAMNVAPSGQSYVPWEAAAFKSQSVFEIVNILEETEEAKKAVSEISTIRRELEEAKDLLCRAEDLLDNVHCYNSKVYHDIRLFLYGPDADYEEIDE
ncbi:hypothetical protein QE320_gp124 [Pseudomonas phage EM]|uniref:Uncharacterized protein n=1 Tax=Pseudomonas phage EM TaxID=2936914 RepID=A0AAE9KTZ7_9CAUD|nr:hypothetical protein QE320_gp124 [Pseudomonas phage EM]UPW35930.1 hypothetical protein EM_145 [Pseudomonas phage EM]